MLTRNIEPVKDNKNRAIVEVKPKTGSIKIFFILAKFCGFERALAVSSKGTEDSEYLGGAIQCYIMKVFPVKLC